MAGDQIAALPYTPSINPYQTLQVRAHLPHFTEEERKALENGKEGYGKEGLSPLAGIQLVGRPGGLHRVTASLYDIPVHLSW